MLKDLLDFLKSRLFLINLALMLALLIAAVFGVRAYLDHITLHGQRITVPDVKGGDFQEAQKILEKRHLNAILKDSVHSKGADPGEVLEQDPEANEKVKKGRNIYITIQAKQKKMVSMPDLHDRSRRLATSLLQTAGLKVKDYEFKPHYCENCVLEQKYKGDPIEPGERIPEGSEITVVLGKGKGDKKTEIPDLTGLTIEESKDRLADALLNIGAAIYEKGCCPTSEDSMKAKVYKQSPPSYENNSVQAGSSVTLYLTRDTAKVNKADSDKSEPAADTNGTFMP